MTCASFSCRRKAVVDVPTGYGATDRYCQACADAWTEAHADWFARLVAFFESRTA